MQPSIVIGELQSLERDLALKKNKEEVLRKHMIKTEEGIRSDVRNIICINSKGRQLRLTQMRHGS